MEKGLLDQVTLLDASLSHMLFHKVPSRVRNQGRNLGFSAHVLFIAINLHFCRSSVNRVLLASSQGNGRNILFCTQCTQVQTNLGAPRKHDCLFARDFLFPNGASLSLRLLQSIEAGLQVFHLLLYFLFSIAGGKECIIGIFELIVPLFLHPVETSTFFLLIIAKSFD